MKEKSGKKQKTASTGKAYVFVSYLFVLLFVGMIAYMVYFQLVKSEELLNSPYNKRQEIYSDSIIRGNIYGINGEELAVTSKDENGNEIRIYPYGNLFAQTVGYSDYGAAGLEATQNHILLESHDNIFEQAQKDLNEQKNNGDSLITTFDVSLQQAAANALAGRKGAVVVLDADTSKVLACVSQPDFDPNTVYENWEYLNLEEMNSPFLNRGLQGMYEPGSTFKIITALAYISEHPDDWNDFYFNCAGEYTQGTYTMHCNNEIAHGEQNLASAFANSCNCAFSYIATELLSKEALSNAAEAVLFNTDFNFELPSSESYFNLSKLNKDGLTMQTAIGQGETLVSPVHMAMIAQAIYNDGIMLQPSFVDKVRNSSYEIVSETQVKQKGQVMGASQAAVLKQLMRSVVEYGTAWQLYDLPLNICGKTGTAEYTNDYGFSHSWFVGFSNTGENDIVIAVVVEEAPMGEAPALFAAKEIFESYCW